jgi:hypothetical protein
MSSSMITVNELSPNESQTASCPAHLSLAISEHSSIQDVQSFIAGLPRWSAVDSLVSPFPSPESAQEPTTSAICGLQLSQPFAQYDHDSRSWKMYQGWLIADISAPSWETWPKAGTTHDGAFYPQPSWERRISEIDSGLLPTPRANKVEGYSSPEFRPTLHQVVLSLPTPTANEGKGSGRKRYLGSKDYRGAKTSEALRTSYNDPIYLNPSFAEWMMDMPLGWTDLKPLAMPNWQAWQQQHGIC